MVHPTNLKATPRTVAAKLTIEKIDQFLKNLDDELFMQNYTHKHTVNCSPTCEWADRKEVVN